jgi:hypothetical protein
LRSRWPRLNSFCGIASCRAQRLLRSHIVSARRGRGDEYQVAAVHRHSARNRDELVSAQQLIAQVLLASAGNPRPQPVRIGERLRIDDMNGRGIWDCYGCQNVSNRIRRSKAFVNGNFEDSCRWINRAVHGADTFAVPASTVQKRSFATGPGGSVHRGFQTPCDKLVSAERRWKRRHV